MPALPSSISRLWRGLRPEHRHRAHFEQVLGTTLEVQLVAGRPAQAMQAQQALLAEIDRLEQTFSRFLPGSELNRWLAGHGPTSVSPELGEVLRQALAWMELSGGAFHPATEALSPLWRAAEATGTVPDVRAVLDVMRAPLYTVTEAAGRWTATLLTRLPLGFNAFAKGYIADQAAVAAAGVPGVTGVMVNLGGDLRCLGPHGIRVDIEDPSTVADNAPALASVRVQDRGAATSGRTRRGFLIGGVWHSHLLDPRDGQPAGRVVSASVVAPDCASADVLATIFSILDPSASLRLADRLPGVACLLVGQDGHLYRNTLWEQEQISSSPLPATEVHHDQTNE